MAEIDTESHLTCYGKPLRSFRQEDGLKVYIFKKSTLAVLWRSTGGSGNRLKKQKDLFDEQGKSDRGLGYGGSDGSEVDLLEYPEMNGYTECAHGLYVGLEGGLEKWET